MPPALMPLGGVISKANEFSYQDGFEYPQIVSKGAALELLLN